MSAAALLGSDAEPDLAALATEFINAALTYGHAIAR